MYKNHNVRIWTNVLLKTINVAATSLLIGCGGGSDTSPTPASTPTASTEQPIPQDPAILDCSGITLTENQITIPPGTLSIDGTEISVNGLPFYMNGVVFEPFFPGESPGSANGIPDDMPYYCILQAAKELGANVVYTSYGAQEHMQNDYFEAAAALSLKLGMGIWFSGEANDFNGNSGDFQNPEFKAHVRNVIETMVDQLHTGFGKDYNELVLYYNIGNELSASAVNNTNENHPNITSYQGEYISTPSASNATEAFLAEMADYLKTYETDTYGSTRPVTHTTWPIVSPSLVDTSFFDFISYNLYSYWPPFVTEHSPGSVTGTPYQGALEELAAIASGKPFLVSEFGASTAPESTLGNVRTESEHAEEFINEWRDISEGPTNVMGAMAFELVDQWHKNDALNLDGSSTPFFHDRDDSEEWFGLIELEGEPGAYVFRKKPAFFALQNVWR